MRGKTHVLLLTGVARLLDQLVRALLAGFEPINLPTQAGLPPIQASAIEKDRAADLTVWLLPLRFFEDAHGDQRADAPVPPEHARFLFEGRDVLRWHFQDQIEDSHESSIVPADCAQGGSLRVCPLVQVAEHGLWQRYCLTPLSPDPLPLCVRGAELESEGGLLVLGSARHLTKPRQLDLRPIGLSLLHPVVSGKGELPCRKDGDALELFIGAGEEARLQELITGLLYHVGPGH